MRGRAGFCVENAPKTASAPHPDTPRNGEKPSGILFQLGVGTNGCDATAQNIGGIRVKAPFYASAPCRCAPRIPAPHYAHETKSSKPERPLTPHVLVATLAMLPSLHTSEEVAQS